MSTIISTSSDRDRGRESDGDKRHPRPVHVTVSKDVKTGKDGQTEGMERQVSLAVTVHTLYHFPMRSEYKSKYNYVCFMDVRAPTEYVY